MQDSLIIGIVLFLLIAALGVYMWLRFQQIETRLNIADSILLDMKMVMQSVSQFPTVPLSEEMEELPAAKDTVTNDIKSIPSYSQIPSLNGVVVTKMNNINEFDNIPLTSDINMEENVATESYPSIVEEMKREMELEHPIASPVNGADYFTMTLKDLRTLAKSRGITGTGSMNRERLVSALKEKDGAADNTNVIEYSMGGIGDEVGSSIDASMSLQE